MAEKEEVLSIEAQLDTSKLKQDAKNGMNAVVQEEKKVEQQSKRTSNAIDEIGKKGKDVGQTLQQAGNAGTQALKQIGNEADKTAKKLSDIDKSVKNIKIGQALGIASRFASSEIGGQVGNALGDAMGMSSESQTLAGGFIQGGLQGAAMGAAGGPWGIAIGLLVGSATGLLNASNKLDQAADEQKQAAQNLQRLQWKTATENAKNYLEGYRKYSEGLDIEKYRKNMMGMSKEQLEERLPALQKMRDAQAQAVESQRKKVDEMAFDLEHGEFEIGKEEKFNEQVKKLQELVSGLGTYDSFISQVQSRISNLTPKEIAEKEAKPELDVERIKGTESLLSQVSKEGQVRLTDSLTRIGGGAGYGGQMQSISSRVVDISKTLKSILETLKNPTPSEESEGTF